MRLGGMSSRNGQDNKFLYNGKEFEDEFGLDLYHYGVRYYDPQLGKWLQIDPADEFYSPYVYCHNDPVNFVDPDGSEEIPDGTMGPLNQGDWYASDALNQTDDFLRAVDFFLKHERDNFMLLHPERPDRDGYLTWYEGILWVKSGGGTLFLDASKYDLGSISTKKFWSSKFSTPKNFWGAPIGPTKFLVDYLYTDGFKNHDTWYIFG